jgi:hypothetical protein
MSRIKAKGLISKEELSAREPDHIVLEFKLKAKGWKPVTGQTDLTKLMWIETFNSH